MRYTVVHREIPAQFNKKNTCTYSDENLKFNIIYYIIEYIYYELYVSMGIVQMGETFFFFLLKQYSIIIFYGSR